MSKPDAFLVKGTTITPVEIQDGSAFHVSMAVRPVGSTDPFRRVMAIQVHDTKLRAAVDIQRYLARQNHEGRRRRRVQAQGWRWQVVAHQTRKFALKLFAELAKK